VRKIGECNPLVADPDLDFARLLMRTPEEVVEQTELMHELERRRMDSIAAEIAEEIPVLLEHRHADSGARKQQTQHHAGRPAAGNAAAHSEHFILAWDVAHDRPPSARLGIRSQLTNEFCARASKSRLRTRLSPA